MMPIEGQQGKDRIWEMMQTLVKVETNVNSIKERVDRMPCTQHGEDIAQIKSQAKLYGGLTGLIVAGVFEFVKALFFEKLVGK